MGENSIINISESRVKDWESEGLRVVCDTSRITWQRTLGIASNAIGVERRKIRGTGVDNSDSKSSSSSSSSSHEVVEKVRENDLDWVWVRIEQRNERILIVPSDRRRRQKRVGVEKEEEKAEAKEEEEEKRVKKCRHARSRGPVSSPFSCSRLIRRVFLLFLSLLGTPNPSSSTQFSSSPSRGPVLVSSSCFALVSLLVVVLLRPVMAVPAVVADDGSASTGSSTSTGPSTINESDATLARIIQWQTNGVVGDKLRGVVENNVDEVANFENVVESTTAKVRRRRHVEYTRQSSYVDENDDDDHDDNDDDDDDEDDEEDEEDAFPASLIQHTRESGLEMRSRLGEAELDTIRRSIVEGLGLERIPDPSKANVSQTEYRRAHEEYLTRLHRSRDSGDGRQRRLHTFHPTERSPVTIVDRTRRSIPEDHQRGTTSLTNDRVLYFPFALPDESAFVDHANVRLLLDPTDTPIEDEDHTISLYRFVTPDSREFVSRHTLKKFDERGPRWIELDTTELTNLWHEENFENLGLQLIFETTSNGRRLTKSDELPTITNSALNVFTSNYPSVEDTRGVRRKRRANPEHLMSLHKGRRTECRGENKKCCRHEMTVIFKDLKGFEFIVQPKNFDAGYCKGRCPPRYNPAHHHALLQSLIWKEDRRKAPRPCCAPSKLDELEILYFDENDTSKLKVSSWKNMKVLECACS